MKKFQSHIARKLIGVGFGLMLCFIAGAKTVHAQAEDPLNKPRIWESLVNNPQDDNLWSRYFGKDLFELTKEEGLQFRTWRSELISALNMQPTARRAYIEDETLNRLTNNISKNFVLIEDYFSSEFSKLGVEYVSYSDKYPDQGFNRIVWVEEHEKKLKNLWHAP